MNTKRLIKAKYILDNEGALALICKASRSDLMTEKIVKGLWGLETDLSNFDPYILWVHPTCVAYVDKFPFEDKGAHAVVGRGPGVWDKCREPFENHPSSISMHQRYAEGRDWSETYMYEIALEKFENDEPVWRSKTIDELMDRFARIDRVYEDMRSSGYKTQLEMYQDGEHSLEEVTKRLCEYQAPNEPRVAIDRNGELIRSTHGKHRLAIARVLGIDRKVPVIVQLEHQKWDRTTNAKREPLTDHPLFYKDGSDE